MLNLWCTEVNSNCFRIIICISILIWQISIIVLTFVSTGSTMKEPMLSHEINYLMYEDNIPCSAECRDYTRFIKTLKKFWPQKCEATPWPQDSIWIWPGYDIYEVLEILKKAKLVMVPILNSWQTTVLVCPYRFLNMANCAIGIILAHRFDWCLFKM